MKIDNKGYESDIEDELIEIHTDLEAHGLSKSNKPCRILKQYQCCY